MTRAWTARAGGAIVRGQAGRVTDAVVAGSAKLHHEDFYAWTRVRAGALRRLAAERWNGPLDLERLAVSQHGLTDDEP